jgi:eukaryotic-like serine/threonine-protein kinase
MAANAGKDHWQLLEELFYEALDQEPSQREAFLDRCCEGNAGLRNEVEVLLNSADKTWGFFQKPFQAAAQQVAPGAAVTGQRIGTYEVIRLLGEGGMGKVYLANRADDLYRQQVAIKLVQGGTGRMRDLLLRFAAERQILANLAHPNIARLLDAGITADGSPYLVMEYVEGVPIDTYVATQSLALSERLQLFRTVCAAVEFAHRNLVVHRDIKPANILATSDGTPKLLDFGIAKLLQPASSTEQAALTRATERLMTPEYASPEQVRGEAVTTATDVYALGGLLYALLTGRPPFRLAAGNPLEIARVICEQPPTRPSSAARSQSTLPGNDQTRLKGDLDNIVLKALRKEPEKRYASVGEFSEDVRRYLEGFPLQAGSQAWTYRTQKFIGRHKLAVSAAALMFLAIIGFSIAMAVLAQRARLERAHAVNEQHKAQQEAAFLSGLFRAATPDAERGKTITARDVLDLSAGRIDRELKAEPEVRAAMLNSIGDSYVALGLYPQAKPLLVEAYSLRKQQAGAGTLELAESASSLSEVWNAEGKYKEQEALLREALAIRQRLAGATSPLVAQSLLSLGESLYLQSRTKEAEPVLRNAVAISPQNSDTLAGAKNFLALVVEKKGAAQEAVQLLRSASEISARTEGTDSPDYLTSMHNLAGALRDLGDLNGAEATERQVLTIRQRVSGPDHPHTTYSLNNLGWILLEKGDWAAAEPYLRQAYDLNRKKLGDKHPRIAVSMNNLGRMLQDKGDYPGAEKYYRQGLAILDENKLSESWSAARIQGNLVLLALDRGDYAGAERYARQALDLERKLGGEDTPDYAASLIDLGVVRSYQRDNAGAETVLRQALEIRKKMYQPGHVFIIAAQVRLGEVLTAEGKLDEAESMLHDASQAAHNSPFALIPWQIAEADSALGVCLVRLGRTAEGVRLLRSSQDALKTRPEAAIRKHALDRAAAILKSQKI